MAVGAPTMEKFRLKFHIAVLIWPFLLTACSSSYLKYDKEATLQKNEEFAQAVKIEEAPAPTPTPTSSPAPTVTPEEKKVPSVRAKTRHAPKEKVSTRRKKGRKKITKKEKAEEPAPAKPAVRQPELEDSAGFPPGERRPYVDPFHVGEVVIHNVSYFGVSAGELKLKVEPFKEVNGRKAYTFATEIKSSSLFNAFYSVDDRAETLVDFADLVPRVFFLHVKESGQLREARSYFDVNKLHASFWEKKVTKKNGAEEKKQEWDILPFSQNVFSAAYYMRIFQWKVGKEYSFRVADDEKNLVFKGIALRKEKLSTDAGEFNAIVVKPTIMTHGVFTPVGDIFIWLSDDEHKYVLRIESKIKIGTIVSEVTKIVPGAP